MDGPPFFSVIWTREEDNFCLFLFFSVLSANGTKGEGWEDKDWPGGDIQRILAPKVNNSILEMLISNINLAKNTFTQAKLEIPLGHCHCLCLPPLNDD